MSEESSQDASGQAPSRSPEKRIVRTPSGSLSIVRVSNGWKLTSSYRLAYPGFPWDLTYKLSRSAEVESVHETKDAMRAFVLEYIDGIEAPEGGASPLDTSPPEV